MSTVATAVAPSSRASLTTRGLRVRPLWPALLIVAVVSVLRMVDTVDSDVAWQLWIAGRLHAGAVLYRDIIEVNPPLWFWMAVPVERLAAALQVRPEPVLAASIGGLAALSLAASYQLLTHIAVAKRSFLLAYAALALTAMPWVHIGQREQLVLIGTLPYAALIAARRQQHDVPALLALLIGAGAALGFALKHYFLIVPIALELWLLVGARRDWTWRRPELAAMILVGLAYAGAILLWAPDFLTRTLPLVALAYGKLGAPGFVDLLGPFALVGLICLAAAAAQGQWGKGEAPFAAALTVSAVAFAAAYFIQAKGWIYHTLPLLGCATLALAALLAELGQKARLLRLVAPALLVLPFVMVYAERGAPPLPSVDLKQAVAGLQPGDAVGFLATDTASPWSVTLQRGFRYPSRYMGFWMLSAVVQNERSANPDPRLIALGRRVVAETVADFACLPPKRIIVSRPRPGEQGFDILPFFERDQAFRSLLGHYRPISRTTVETYVLARPLPQLPPASCRTGI